MAAPKNIAILILAAGASSRMGRTKQLLPWQDTTLLGSAIRTARDSNAKSVAVVLGANAESIRGRVNVGRGVKTDADFVENTAWETGLGSSIACGTEFLIEKKIVYDGILIMLADQPLIDTEY
jgi:molybdenum cofactor cytidylyltransferase